MFSIIRATFGRLSENSIAKVTIGHIDIQEVVDIITRRKNTGGFAGKHKQSDQGVKFEPLVDNYIKQAKKEDIELVDIVIALLEGKLI